MATDNSKNLPELSAYKQELLALLLTQEAAETNIIPLSFAQRRLWFIEQMGRGSYVYNICTSVRLRGDLDEAALEQSFNEIVRRHEGLRTTFSLVDKQPVQVVAAVLKVKISVVSLATLPEAEREPEVQKLLQEESQTSFDLSRGPLLRVKLLRLAAHEWVLMLTMHHIISDGWSMGVLVREMVALYEAFRQQKPSPLAELSIQYPDFVLWQHEWLQGEMLERGLTYWKQQLSGAPAGLDLPTDYARPAINKYRGAKQSMALSADLSDALKALSEREGVTLFMTLLAAFKTLCYRYTGQADVVVGTPIANRNRAETEALIGFFVNTLVLRTDLSDDPTFANLLRRVREVSLEAYAHQDVPFEKLVEELQPERSLSHTPLFQVMFVLQNAPMGQVQLPGLSLTPMTVDNRTSKFDLTLFMEETAEGIVGTLEYNTELFAPASIKRMLNHYRQVLQAIVTNPQGRLSELGLLSEEERRQIVVEWNETAVRWPELVYDWSETGAQDRAEPSVHKLIEEQVERSPLAVAVRCRDEELSYEELNGRANQLGHRLQGLGVGPETVVGLMVERGVEMVVGLLAILKAGGAYLPLDPSYPRERLEWMLEDAGVRVLVRGAGIEIQLSGYQGALVSVEEQEGEWGGTSRANCVSGVRGENLAYVIYTSGSTGRPKGVMVEHRNVVNFLLSMQSQPGLSPGDTLLAVTTFGFDIAGLELYLPLTVGARVIVVGSETVTDGSRLAALIRESQTTVMQATPATWQMLLDSGWAGEPGLRVLCGGEALTPELASQLAPRTARLWNLYGPTETTIWSTTEVVSGADEVVRLGRPIANTQVYILDDQQQVVPVGVRGELYIGGLGVARGYWGRAELTAERFVPDGFSPEAGGRLYRTGDLVRYQEDGAIEYLGRRDQQVKLRGYRIELEEIEAALREHAGVGEAVVVLREQRLVAYLKRAGEQPAPTGNQLRLYLRGKLPEYMVPRVYVELAQLPRTPNGKLDRRALPAPELQRTQLEGAYVAPRNEVEQILANVWAEVLRVKQVGVHDNYFEIGGDSIRSVILLATANERGVSFSLEQLFQYPTIGELVKEIEVNGSSSAPALITEPFSLTNAEDRLRMPEGLEDAYPLTMLQAGMLFHIEYSPDSSFYHNVSSYHLRAGFDEAALGTAVRQVIGMHPALRTSFNLNGYSEPLQLVHKSVPLPVLVEDLRHLSNEGQEQLIAAAIETEKSLKFDYTQPPLLRVRVHRRTDKTFQFTLTEHHAILDGWSVASLLAELFNRYFAILKDDNSAYLSEPPLSGSFREFVALEREILLSEEARDFWSRKLSGSTVTVIPRWPRGSEASAGAKLIHAAVPISPVISAGLKNLALAASVPLKSVLLAAYLRVMSLLSAQQDVVTGIVSHGRPPGTDGERVLGLYLNTLPFRLKLTGGSWLDLAKETFAAECELLPYRRYPMAQIQNEQGHALFETFFNFVNFHVYEGLEAMSEVEVLGASAFSDTNYTLSAEFSLAGDSSDITLILSGGALELGKEQMSAIGDYFAMTLTAMSDNATSAYSGVSLLPPAERRQIVEDWNRTGRDYEAGVCLHQMFEQQVVETPAATALVCDDQHLSYDELNRRANQLAHYLISLGVGAESRVGIMMQRSPEMLISLLAVLKANGAYVPLDLAYPEERLSFMLEDAGVAVLLTQSDLQTRAPCSHQATVVCVEAIGDILNEQPDDNPHSVVRADNLAYVIYTSGSTGTPKGVAITHKSASTMLHWAQEEFTSAQLAGVLASTSINFDLSVFELFVPLSVGGTVLLVANALALPGLAEREQVTLINTVPSAIAELIRTDRLPDSVGVINLAGEPLTRNLVQRIYEQPFVRHVVNLYGPSEDTTYSTCAWVSRDKDQSVTIGRPIANTQTYLLDVNMQPVPLGTTGEIYIGGDGLARGYLRRPELTAEKFVPNSFSTSGGARLYRTGDVGRYLRNGEIEFLGRIDHQIKLRGFRIELGEIEAVLASHPSVGECAVLLREDVAGDKRLVAYLTQQEAGAPTSNELRALIKQKLPEYMMPSAFVRLEEMPLTLNGKIDRKRLPAPEETREGGGAEFAGPRTAVEEILVGIWMQVLGRKQVSIRDDFFEIGGHSLLATQIISRVRETFHAEISLRSLFGAPTIEGLAGHVEAALPSASALLSSPLVSVARGGELPLSFAQQRLWFLDQVMPDTAAYNIAEAIRLKGTLNVGALAQTLNEVTRRHEILRTTFLSINGHARQVIAPALNIDLQVIDLSEGPLTARESEARQLAEREAQTPFDLAHGPLLRARLLRLDEDDHVLLFTMHHIISDAWSMGVLAGEVAALYKAFLLGESSQLAELPLQYADYAHWQREWLQGTTLEAHLAYWREHLTGASPLLHLPTDRPRQAEPTFTGSSYSISFSEALSDSLKVFSHKEGSTLFMTLLAGFNVLLHHYSGANDILVGTDVANRNRLEIEPLIGFFINQLVLRGKVSTDASFHELLGQVRDVTLASYAHQDLPFDRLIDGLKIVRTAAYPPLFQVKFVFQNAPHETLELPGLNISSMGISSGMSRFDLQLTLGEEAGKLRGWFEYNAELFDAATIAELSEDLSAILERVVTQPGILIGELDRILNEASEKRKAVTKEEGKEILSNKYKTLRRKAVTIPAAEVVGSVP